MVVVVVPVPHVTQSSKQATGPLQVGVINVGDDDAVLLPFEPAFRLQEMSRIEGRMPGSGGGTSPRVRKRARGKLQAWPPPHKEVRSWNAAAAGPAPLALCCRRWPAPLPALARPSPALPAGQLKTLGGMGTATAAVRFEQNTVDMARKLPTCVRGHATGEATHSASPATSQNVRACLNAYVTNAVHLVQTSIWGLR